MEAWPWSSFLEMYTWWVPIKFFQQLKTLNGSELRIPERWDEYLSFRYGDWRMPKRNWEYVRDDGAVLHEPPESALWEQLRSELASFMLELKNM